MTPSSADRDPVPPCRASAPAPGVRLTLLIARGELDAGTADELDRALRAAVPDDHPDRALVLDLRGVGFMDCAALAMLVGARNRLGDRFWLAGPSRSVRRLLDLSGLTTSFAVLAEPYDVRIVTAVHEVPAARESS